MCTQNCHLNFNSTHCAPAQVLDANISDPELAAGDANAAQASEANISKPEFSNREPFLITIKTFKIDLNRIGYPWEMPQEPFNPSMLN